LSSILPLSTQLHLSLCLLFLESPRPHRALPSFPTRRSSDLFTQKETADSAIYYDIPAYRSFWATVSELDVPFYLHPRMPIPARAQPYEGHPWLLSSPWGFAVETSIHALRLCGSGLFDDFPNLKIAIGHLGQHIPYALC